LSALDLNRWQRLAPMALLFLIIGGGAKFVRENLFFFAGAGAGFAFLDRLGMREFLLGGLVLLLGAIVMAMIYHRRFRFRIEGDAIRVRRGLFEQKDLRVRFARVQNVSLSQPVYFRPFELVRFSIETPGADSTEVELPGISQALALALRDHIARYAGDVSTADESASDEPAGGAADAERTGDVLHQPSSGRIFAHGLVSNQVWLIAGIAAWLSGTFWERIEGWLDSVGVSQAAQMILSLGWAGAAALVVGLTLALFALSGALALVRFHDFCLRDHGDRVLALAGLLDRREQTIRREKLTGLTLYQTALGRLIGQWYLIGKQATSKEIDIDPRGENFLVPGMRPSDLTLVGRLMPGLAVPERLSPISRRFRTLFWTRLSAVFLTGCGLAWWWLPDLRLAVAGVLILLLLILWLIHRSWRRWGWQVVDGVCWVRQGLIGQRLDGFELSAVQQATLVRTPYFRRYGLASVRLVLPHGQIQVPFLTLEDASALINRAVYAAETARRHRV
jgi:putative membrane protein